MNAERELIEAAQQAAAVLAEVELIEAANAAAAILEARGEYVYEEITLKRWNLGPGGKEGNCEDCIENSEAGWIEESEPFPADGQYGVVDEPPLHDHCECEAEYRDTRRRVPA